MRLTDTAVKNLKPKDAKYYIHGDMSNGRHGFAVCVYPNGTKSWFFICRFDGKRCFVPLGKYPTVGVGDAAKEFDKHWQVLATGKNPATVKDEDQAEREAAPTVKELGADYIKRHAEVNKKSWQEDQRILDVEIYPAWGKRKAQDITKGNIITLLDKVVDRGSPQTANNIFKILRKLFNWAVEKDRLKISPCMGIKMPAPLNLKERALTVEEIKTLWAALESPTLSMTSEVRQATKLILITAQRPGEVAGMHTREIDGNWWTIPAERSKNGKAHRVYLSTIAQDIIKQAIETTKTRKTKAQTRAGEKVTTEKEYSGFIFPCPHRAKDKPIERHAFSKALKRNESKDKLTTLGIATWTPHDLRRSAATFMAESGELDEVIDAVLNHSKQGIIKVYNLYRYDKEKQAALESWARKLTSITTAKDLSNVISIQTGKAA